MLQNRIKEAFDEAVRQRNELVDKLVSFVACDSLLFVVKDTPSEVKERLEKAVFKVNAILGTAFALTDKIDVPLSNLEQKKAVFEYFNSCSDDKVAYIYLMATELRSVLVAVLSAEKEISLCEAFDLAFYEEINQQKKWGLTEDAEQRQCSIKSNLQDLARIGYEKSLFRE